MRDLNESRDGSAHNPQFVSMQPTITSSILIKRQEEKEVEDALNKRITSEPVLVDRYESVDVSDLMPDEENVDEARS